MRASPRATCPVLAGPTASGKTALVVLLAAELPLEVVSLDSRQIFAGMRIGTAQPTKQEQAACRHHLIDFVSPRESYSAARFRKDFVAAYEDIRARGKLPLLVGGAGLYLKALEFGLFEAPGLYPVEGAIVGHLLLDDLTDDEVRDRLEAVDPDSWARIHPADRYRSQRALEIAMATGLTMTELAARHHANPDPALGLSFPLVWVTRERSELHARIEARTQAMLAAGWVEETESLVADHGENARALRTIGYREIRDLLAGTATLEWAAERIIAATRQYAKRQETWFRPLPTAIKGTPDDPQVRATLVRLLSDSAGN